MTRSPLALAALSLALATSASADLFGLTGAAKDETLTPVQVSDLPDAHWNFQKNDSGDHAIVDGYSPNLDGLGFDNASRCYGHSLLSTRWFQYVVKPLKNGTVDRITPEEFRDFWSGYMEYPPSYDLTAANVDADRLQAYSTYNDKARVAVGKLVGLYHDMQFNYWDHNDTKYDDPSQFRADLASRINRTGLPPQLGMFRNGGAHAVNAYKVVEGTAVYGNNGTGEAGTSSRAWKVSLYDPNEPGSGDASDDTQYENENYFIVIEEGGGFIGFSELMERDYDRYLQQSSEHPAGTWHIPGDNYAITSNTEDDSGELASWWHWNSISDAEAREISGLAD